MATSISPAPSLISTAMVVNAVIFVLLATFAVALRFYARKKKSLDIQWDDWTILIALMMSWILFINTMVTAGIGGVDKTILPPLQASVLFNRCLWIEGFPLRIGLAVIKISILLFYRRIFVTKIFRRCVDFTNAVIVAWCISMVLCQLFVTYPIQDAWNPKKANTFLYNYNAFALAFSGMSIVFDIIVLCFPIPVIKSLQMPTRRKVTVMAIFWLGGFCCVAAALRFYFVYEGQKRVRDPSGNRYAYATREYTWAHIEPNCSIVAACLPTYAPIFPGKDSFDKWVDILRSWTSLGSRPNGSYIFRPGRGNGVEGGTGSDSGLVLDSKKSGTWQKLDAGDLDGNHQHTVDVTGAALTEREEMEAAMTRHEDLEAQIEGQAPLKIAVTRGFGCIHGETS